jgi:hypothetical protein
MKRGTRRLLTLERLENRTLLSTCNVTRLGDFGAGATLGDFSRGDLRFCITHANANPGPDTINIKVNGTIELNSALPNLEGELTIDGPGAGLLTIDARQNARVLFIASGANVEITGVTMTGGRSAEGAGIHNKGSLSLRECSVSQNLVPASPGYGGGIFNTGSLWLWGSQVSENTVDAYAGFGGGIANYGTLMVHSSLIWNNELPATGYSGFVLGGGIYNHQGQTTVIDTTIAANVIIGGAYGFGGGIYSSGTLDVRSSLIADNTVYSDYARGGGIGTNEGDTSVINSTIVRNTANSGPWESDIGGFGGGLHQEEGKLFIAHSTITQNYATGKLYGNGGGLSNSALDFVMHHTILAENVSTNGDDEIHGYLGLFSYNLIGGDPMLAPLQDNGGPTFTMALLPGSPAIDAGDGSLEDPPEWDQRGPGFPRIVNGPIDIGAFEVQATGAPLPTYFLAALLTADLEGDGKI